ncbi:MAG: radical SAM protein [Elusimicrobia bacterium]|nr:radical SAM protein [Elusimicrobiota bacterium]
MKVFLVKPYNISDHIQPSLGLGYLANSIKKDHDVKIVDCIKEKLDIDGLREFVKKDPPDVIGFQFYTYDFSFIKSAVRMIKENFPDITTVAGGPHPSSCGLEIINQIKEIDFLFQGEAEKGFPDLLNVLSNQSGQPLAGKSNDFSKICGLVWRKDVCQPVCNPPSFSENIDSLGFPAWDLIHPETYPEAQHGAFFKNFPIAPIITTRGCPFSCTFCAAYRTTGKKMRMRSAKNVVDEIELLYTKFGIREIHIVDDNFTLNKNHAKSILKELKERGLKISWAVPNGIRLGTLDTELLELMKETGCYLVSVGVESGSDRILKLMKKSLTVDVIRREIKFIKSFGFEMAGFFIVGFPGETEDDISKTISFAKELPLVRANFFTFLPLPGTEAYAGLEKSGELSNVDWEKFLFTSAPYVPKDLTRKGLKRLQRKAFLSFFMRPNIVIKNILAIKSFRHFKFLLRRALNWLG